jgi:hypothetical protein
LSSDVPLKSIQFAARLLERYGSCFVDRMAWDVQMRLVTEIAHLHHSAEAVSVRAGPMALTRAELKQILEDIEFAKGFGMSAVEPRTLATLREALPQAETSLAPLAASSIASNGQSVQPSRRRRRSAFWRGRAHAG